MSFRNFGPLFFALLFAVNLLGCGGGDEATPAAAPPAPTPIKINTPGAPKPPATAKKDTGNKNAKPKQGANQSPKRPKGEIDPDAFAIMTDFANYEIRGYLDGDTADESVDVITSKKEPNSYAVSRNSPTTETGSPTNRSALPSGFRAVTEWGYNDEGLPRRIVNQLDGGVMALVPAGVFTLGKEDDDPDASPQVSMYLDNFYIDLYEVKLEQYEAYRTREREAKRRIPSPAVNENSSQDHPALGVQWGQARAYLREMGKDLPTEAEWEKAARGPEGNPHPWGSGRAVWAGVRPRIAAVGAHQLDESYYGVIDLGGNAREWCLDWYAPDAHQQARDAGGPTPRNWGGPKVARPRNHRVVKGDTKEWEMWTRTGVDMSEPDETIGFRGVLRLYELQQ